MRESNDILTRAFSRVGLLRHIRTITYWSLSVEETVEFIEWLVPEMRRAGHSEEFIEEIVEDACDALDLHLATAMGERPASRPPQLSKEAAGGATSDLAVSRMTQRPSVQPRPV